MKFDKFQLNLFAPAEIVGGGSTATKPPKEIKTVNTKTTAKTTKPAAKPATTKPAAVKTVKTAKGHTLAAVKGGKLVKIAERIREDATAAKPSKTLEAAIKERAAKIGIDPKRVIVASVPVGGVKEAAKPQPKPPKASGPAKVAPAAPTAPQPPKPKKPVETFREMIARHFRERQAVAPLWIKPPAPDSIPTPSGWIPRAKLAALVALKARQAKEHHAAIIGRPAETFAEVLDLFKGDPRAALFAAGVTFHDDRGDGRLHVPLFGRHRPVFEAWKKVAALKGYKFATESVGA